MSNSNILYNPSAHEILVRDSGYTGNNQGIQNLFSNPNFTQVGGRVVIGEPWNHPVDGNTGTMTRVYFSHEEYEACIQTLANKIQESGKQYDAVVTMPKGGISIGAHIAKTLGIPLGYMHASSYTTNGKQLQLTINQFNPGAGFPPENTEKRILLVDDLADSGNTFARVKSHFEALGYIVETAALFHKNKEGVAIPDHCLFPNYPDIWLVQPTENLEQGSALENYPVGGVDSHYCTLQAIKTAAQVLSLLRGTANVKKIQMFIPKNVSIPQAMVATGVARLLAQYQIEFLPERGPYGSGCLSVVDDTGKSEFDIRIVQDANIPITIALIDEHTDTLSYSCTGGHGIKNIDPSSGMVTRYEVMISEEEMNSLNAAANTYHQDSSQYNLLCQTILARYFGR